MSADVVELFLTAARSRPDSGAVAETGGVIGYGQLAASAWGLAGLLAAYGPNPRVAILLPQGSAAYAAMFGVLMAGGYYLPMNAQSVAAKLASTLDRFSPDVVIGPASHPAIPEGTPVIDGWPSDPSPPRPRPGHRLAYVIFTSGSTGTPKGVMISRQALGHYVGWVQDAMTPGPGDRWSQHPNIGFDLSVLDIYGALCTGAELHPLQTATDRMLPGRFIASRRLTIWNSVPSLLDMMAKSGDLKSDSMGSVRLFTFCGEPFHSAQAGRLRAAAPNAAIHNTYGPTEATVSCTLARLTPDLLDGAAGGSLALGDAIPGMALHLLDEPEGQELAISGPQLADGYWGDEERTASAFTELTDVEGGRVRVYRTGDLVRRRGGQLYFDRRRDTQVKIRGHRLELDEVNTALRALGFNEAATVLAEGRLVSFVATKGAVDAAQLRASLATRLDEHAVPSDIRPLDQLPRNANDKIDLGALIRLVAERPS